MASDWTTTHCIQEEGFSQVLYAATVQLGILDRSKYVGREYVEDGTEYCEVTVHIGASGRFLEMERGVLLPPRPVCPTPISLLPAKP
jgi:hypothetical protein